MDNKNKNTNVNPAKNLKPTPVPVKTTRNDGGKYRYSLEKGKNS